MHYDIRQETTHQLKCTVIVNSLACRTHHVKYVRASPAQHAYWISIFSICCWPAKNRDPKLTLTPAQDPIQPNIPRFAATTEPHAPPPATAPPARRLSVAPPAPWSAPPPPATSHPSLELRAVLGVRQQPAQGGGGGRRPSGGEVRQVQRERTHDVPTLPLNLSVLRIILHASSIASY